MAIKTLSKCPVCSYPIQAEYEGQPAVCAYCGENLIAQGVTIPTPLFAGLIGFGIGLLIGPAIIATSAAGRDWLVKQARAKLA